jgi:hypothetical protein
MEQQGDFVRLKCVKEGNKLRIKVLSGGYSPHANCQFPRDIRTEGREYLVPKSDITFTETRNKFFYRVKKNNIHVLEPSTSPSLDFSTMTIFGDSDSKECQICMMDDSELVIFAMCGHQCACMNCATEIHNRGQNCPLCRSKIQQIVSRDQLQ